MDTQIDYLTISPEGTVARATGVLTEKAIGDLVHHRLFGHIGGSGAVAFHNTAHDPMLRGEYNWLATTWLKPHLHPADRITGTVVVTGPPDDDGNLTNVTDQLEEQLRSMAATREA